MHRVRLNSMPGKDVFHDDLYKYLWVFFRALAMNGLLTLHVTRRAGRNAHHVAEAAFKAVARALRMAVEPDPRAAGAIPSTKGSL